MPRSYRHIQECEKEIIELKNKDYTGRQICEKFRFSKKQYENFISKYNIKQDKIAVGIAIKRKGRHSFFCAVCTNWGSSIVFILFVLLMCGG